MRSPLQTQSEAPVTEDAPQPSALLPLQPAAQAVLRLQRLIGNAATTALIARELATAPPAAAVPPTPEKWESWTEDEIKAVQRELTRMRFYDLGIDGRLGRFSEQGLTEAFGSEEWRQLDAATALSRLSAATRAKPAAGAYGRNLRYAELFKDGVFDVTFGMGYKEADTEEQEFSAKSSTAVLEAQLLELLDKRGFKEDPKLALKLLAQAGRSVADPEYGRWFVKENATTYSPPAGHSRQIHAVIRVLRNTKPDEGGRARAAFMESLARGDASFYTGHGRYGTGPDFDRNFVQFRLYDKKGDPKPRLVLRQYEALEKELAKYGKAPFTVFKEMVADGRLEVDFANLGNVRLVGSTSHQSEFGAALQQWALEQTGTGVVTGKEGELAKVAAEGARKYRLVAFAGCRTADYDKALRETPGFTTREADIMETTRTVAAGYAAFVFTSFVDSVLNQMTKSQMQSAANVEFAKHEPGSPGAAVTITGETEGPRG